MLDKLHRVSFEKSRGLDKKYPAGERMWRIEADGGSKWRNGGCGRYGQMANGGCGRLWWREQLVL